MRRVSWIFAVFLATAGVIRAENEPTLAFPGAEGFGRFATGGRGGRVIAVTNLNDAGPGSLRAAIEAEGPRTVVFHVAGTIFLKKQLKIDHGDLTIAGQTAPGDGITVARRGIAIGMADNVIIRFIRSRLGDTYPREKGLEHFNEDAFTCRYATRVMVDHCSFSWSTDETATMYEVKDSTMQWCFVTESLNDSFHEKGPHGYGGIWGGESATFHHNLLATHRSRLPRFNGARYHDYEEWGDDLIDCRNNVIYNWGQNTAYGGEPHSSGFQASYNMVANIYRPGPATRRRVDDRIARPDPNDAGQFSRLYVADNYVFGAPEVTADNALGVDGIPTGQRAETLVAEPFPAAPVHTESPLTAYARVLAQGGAIFPVRDPVDRRVVDEVRQGTSSGGEDGLIDSQDEVGGYPALKGGEAPPDRDGDGMPDAWETAHSLDPDDATDGARPGASGYTPLEDYLNTLVAAVWNWDASETP